MADTITLRVLTPLGVAFEENAASVKVPTTDGQVTLLPRHRSYTAILGTGVLEFESTARKGVERAVISGGFLTFSDEILVLLTDSVDLLDSIDRDTYASDRVKLNAILQEGDSADPERVLAFDKLARINAIDNLLSTRS